MQDHHRSHHSTGYRPYPSTICLPGIRRCPPSPNSSHLRNHGMYFSFLRDEDERDHGETLHLELKGTVKDILNLGTTDAEEPRGSFRLPESSNNTPVVRRLRLYNFSKLIASAGSPSNGRNRLPERKQTTPTHATELIRKQTSGSNIKEWLPWEVPTPRSPSFFTPGDSDRRQE